MLHASAGPSLPKTWDMEALGDVHAMQVTLSCMQWGNVHACSRGHTSNCGTSLNTGPTQRPQPFFFPSASMRSTLTVALVAPSASLSARRSIELCSCPGGSWHVMMHSMGSGSLGSLSLGKGTSDRAAMRGQASWPSTWQL